MGQLLKRGGYRINVLNTINFSESMRYNPFAYPHSEKDILKLVNTIIANTKGDGEKSGKDFGVKSAQLFYTALIGYLWYEASENEKNFTTLFERLAPFDIREVRKLMETGEIDLDILGDRKTALFLIMSDADTTFNFILAMLQSQLINLLCDRPMMCTAGGFPPMCV